MILNQFDGNKKQPSLGSYDPLLGYLLLNTFHMILNQDASLIVKVNVMKTIC